MMERLPKAAILTKLIQKLREKNSWCGETHIQKATYFLQRMMQVPLEFDFILYKHGPFSFDLRDELTSMRADELIELEPQSPYGPRIAPTDRCGYIQSLYSKTLAQYEDRLGFVADKVGIKGVAELECLATAFYVIENKNGESSPDERAQEITRLKPHVTHGKALSAVKAIDEIMKEIGTSIN